MSEESIKKNRLDKLSRLEALKINAYPLNFEKPTEVYSVVHPFKKGKNVVLVGRIMTLRRHGGSLFLDLKDFSGKIQAFLKKDNLKKSYQTFVDNIDVGDFILLNGKLFLTKRGEKTIEVNNFQILSKSLLPLPEKWHGLQDVEDRYRKRYLDLIMSDEVKEKFIIRAKVISQIRFFLDNQGFLEVETPILQPIYGGAAANPFKTYHNALDISLFLRIAPELYLKKLLIGGFERVYEIGRVFRNEGIDKSHNPDFTSLEFYWSYKNIQETMDFCEKMIKDILKKVFKANKIETGGKKIDLSSSFKKVDFYSELKRKFGKNIQESTDKDIHSIAKKLNIPIKGKSRFKLLDDIFKKSCTEKIVNPTFVLHQPVELTPLAKNDEKKPYLASRFQLIIGGWEIVNSFSELNDPREQKRRFEQERLGKKRGDQEAHPYDKEFIEALEYGMPPAVGLGMGIDRLVALLTDSNTLKEVILFPLLRPKS
jgi:lysyl-tRNA synthetase class 2